MKYTGQDRTLIALRKRGGDIEDAIRERTDEDIAVHALTCPMGAGCTCTPITLQFGATA